MSVNKLLVQILPWYASGEQNYNFLSILNLKVFFFSCMLLSKNAVVIVISRITGDQFVRETTAQLTL